MWTRIQAFLDWCFFGPASVRAGMLGGSLRVLRYPYAVVRDLWRGEINLRAMSLVYTSLLSLIPLLAFSFAILKAFGGYRDLEPIVYELFRPVGGAAATELTTRVVQFASHVSSGVVGSVGLALLAWTLLGTIKKVEDSFNFLWHVDQPRSFARRLAEHTSLLIAGPVLLVGFVGLSHAALSSAPVQEMVHLPLLHLLRSTAISVAPYVMVTAFFTAMYMMIPNTRVQWRAALIGALAGGIPWAARGQKVSPVAPFSPPPTPRGRGVAGGAHRGAGGRHPVGRRRQDVHRVRHVLHAPHHRVRGIRVRGGGAAVDVFRLADPAGRCATVVLRAEPNVPASGPAAAAALEWGARAAGAETDVLRGPHACRRRTALERESPRHGAGTAGHRGGADGRDARARRAADRHRLRRAGSGARHRAHRRVRDTRHRAQPGQRPRRAPSSPI